MAKLVVLGALLVCVLTQINLVNATTFNVGDDKGWTFGVESWPDGKSFKVGDVLVFKYPPEVHNVFIVKEADYNTCNASGTKYDSGNDQITLAAGTTYFICGIGSHCAARMKIAITAN